MQTCLSKRYPFNLCVSSQCEMQLTYFTLQSVPPAAVAAREKNVRFSSDWSSAEKFGVLYEDSNPQKPHRQLIFMVSLMKYLLRSHT